MEGRKKGGTHGAIEGMNDTVHYDEETEGVGARDETDHPGRNKWNGVCVVVLMWLGRGRTGEDAKNECTTILLTTTDITLRLVRLRVEGGDGWPH